jgi:arylsulfatase A-like enzyme
MGTGQSRRSFLRTGIAASLGLAIAPRARTQDTSSVRKPNLVVFLPDQQRADTLACYGGRFDIAPNLNKLASQSFVFQQAYVTQPICTPSRSSLLTGTWPHTNGCVHNETVLDRRFACLPELLGDPEYCWAYMGKWHLGDELSAQHGFSEWVSIMDGHMAGLPDTKEISDYSKFLFSKGFKPRGKHAHPYFTQGDATRMPIELSQPAFLAGRACEFIERHRREPIVLFVSYFEPHPPYTGPLNELHPLNSIDLEPTFGQIFGPDMPLRYRLRQKADRKGYGRRVAQHRLLKQRYLGLVTEVDRSIGAILTKLEETSLLDRTIVVHTSDHGDMMGAHDLFGKAVMFQEAARVPLLVRMPGQRRPVEIAEPISHIDFAPTILDLLGDRSSEQCAGRSRANVLRGEAMSADPVYMEWAFEPFNVRRVDKDWRQPVNQTAIHETTRATVSADGWKLCLRDMDQNELYNVRLDPHEEINLYGRPETRDVITRLSGHIYSWQETVNDRIKVSSA